jgi:hypothetical protein
MNTWIFQGNPDRFDVDTYLARARQILWLVGQKYLAAEMHGGDRMFLWRASGHSKVPSGIVASGWLVEAPKVQPDDNWSRDLWKGPVKAGEALRVRIDVDRVAPGAKEIVHADWLKDDPVCNGLRILKHGETNYLVSPAEARRLETLWKNTGRDWTRAESIAGLWAYHRTYRGPVSRAPGAPIASVAERIGRAVTGVYNKVMNFRAIDPRDTRAGLAAGSQTDRSVWEEFYDSEKKTLHSVDLGSAFEQLWPETSGGASLDGISLKDALSTASGRRGQGLISDPAVRKAVELRAMALAKEHYGRGRPFARVEDTSATRPFDLRCIAHDGVETRVEVKGGTGNLDEVRVTAGEVDNARGTRWNTDLFLVSNIEVSFSPSGFQASGGQVRLITGWRPQTQDLKPLAFTCRLPDTVDPRGPKGK